MRIYYTVSIDATITQLLYCAHPKKPHMLRSFWYLRNVGKARKKIK